MCSKPGAGLLSASPAAVPGARMVAAGPTSQHSAAQHGHKRTSAVTALNSTSHLGGVQRELPQAGPALAVVARAGAHGAILQRATRGAWCDSVQQSAGGVTTQRKHDRLLPATWENPVCESAPLTTHLGDAAVKGVGPHAGAGVGGPGDLVLGTPLLADGGVVPAPMTGGPQGREWEVGEGSQGSVGYGPRCGRPTSQPANCMFQMPTCTGHIRACCS